jgi:transcriptional regulator PpsR
MAETVNTFRARVGATGPLSGETAADVIEASADIALVLDEAGRIRDVHLSGESTISGTSEWLGMSWEDTVTPETRPKVHAMLQAAREGGYGRPRQVNHVLAAGEDFPVRYSVVQLASKGLTLAIGRDLRAMSVLQQRLIEAQQSMERDYWRMRHVDTRYRLLFQLTSEAVMVVDAGNGKVVEANPPAGRAFDMAPRKLVGRAFTTQLDSRSQAAVEEYFSIVRNRGEGEAVRITTATGDWTLSATLVRYDSAPLFLLRMLPVAGGEGGDQRPERGRMLDVLHRSPDGFALVTPEGQILAANLSFQDLAEVPSEDQVRAQPVGRWLGHPGADAPTLLATAREHGVVRLFNTTIQGELGTVSDVEVSAVAVNGSLPCVGMTIRHVGRRLDAVGPRGAEDLTRAVEQLTGLVGRVSLKDLVRDTTDMVERHFIDAALELTNGNRTSAAEILGVSRQSLYVKLRRHGDPAARD